MPELVTICSDCRDELDPTEFAEHLIDGKCPPVVYPPIDLHINAVGQLVVGTWQPDLWSS